ncbi:MAG TPA: PRC-barrel domain-containing protein [Ktedonobacterales bacterium]
MRNNADDNRRQDDIVAVPIAEWMDEGLPVYDVDGAKIGVVRRYDLNAGYMEVEAGGLARKELYVPFHLMQSITPREIYLRIPKDALTDAFLLPPAASPLVEEQTDPSTGRTEAVLTHEMRSGYDGRPVQVEPVRVDELTRTLTVGMTVLDIDDAYVGEVTRVDTTRGLLIVRGSLTTEAVRTVPFGVVAHVDPDTEVVTLLVPTAALPTER